MDGNGDIAYGKKYWQPNNKEKYVEKTRDFDV